MTNALDRATDAREMHAADLNDAVGLQKLVHPDRIASCFRGELPAATLAALMSEARFKDRLSDLVCTQFDLAMDTPVLLAAATGSSGRPPIDFPTLEQFVAESGAIVWSASFVREVRKPKVEALVERFGEQVFRSALANHDLGFNRPQLSDIDELQRAVTADGRRCVGAWIASLPAMDARALRLCWPTDADVPATDDKAFLQHGPAIVRRVMDGRTGQMHD